MRLLVLLTARRRGGVEGYALEVAAAAVRAGWDVEAAFPRSAGAAALATDFVARGASHAPLSIAETDLPEPDEPLSLLRRAWLRVRTIVEKPLHFLRVASHLRRRRPDVVLLAVPWPTQCSAAILACGLSKVPTAVVFQLFPSRHAFGAARRALFGWARRRNQQWIAVSDQNRRCVEESFGIAPGETIRIYNGARFDPSSIPSPEDRDALRREVRRELGVREDARLLVTVARLTRQKGHDYLVPAVPRLVAAFPDIRFVWVGDGERQGELQRRLRELGAEAAVVFVGHSTGVHRLLDAADLFVFPTYYEGLPFALLEAMARGVPIVASATSGIPELVEDRVHGLLTPTGDSARLSAAIAWALEHPEDMRRMAQRAEGRVGEFSEERMLTATLAVLTRLARLQGHP